jgi:hypothetical protein
MHTRQGIRRGAASIPHRQAASNHGIPAPPPFTHRGSGAMPLGHLIFGARARNLMISKNLNMRMVYLILAAHRIK